MQSFVPKEVFFTKGLGVHKFRLSSFEDALRNAGVANQNLVSVSSILPPGCIIIHKEEGLAKLLPGTIRYTVISRIDTNEHGRRIAASIGLAQPKESTQWGYLSEVHEYGFTQRGSADMAEDLAASMLGTTLGIEVDPDKAWSEREKLYKMSGKIVKTYNVTQSAEGDKNGLWTTVLASAILLP